MDKPSDTKVLRSNEIKFELRTAGTHQDGGYKDHYQQNVISNPELSNRVSDILKMGNKEQQDPFYQCPSCDSINLFNSLHENYIYCEDCDKLSLKDKALSKNFNIKDGE